MSESVHCDATTVDWEMEETRSGEQAVLTMKDTEGKRHIVARFPVSARFGKDMAQVCARAIRAAWTRGGAEARPQTVASPSAQQARAGSQNTASRSDGTRAIDLDERKP